MMDPRLSQEPPRAFLSMHWSGNGELRDFLRNALENTMVEVVEADRSPINKAGKFGTDELDEHVKKEIRGSDIVVAVYSDQSEAGALNWVNAEVGFAASEDKIIVGLWDRSAGPQNKPPLVGEDLLVEIDTGKMKTWFRAFVAIQEAIKEHDRRLTGFKLERLNTEVRFMDWGETTHREVYQKYLRVHPYRSGPLDVCVMSGSSDPSLHTAPGPHILSTHERETADLEDGFHVRTTNKIVAAVKGQAIHIVEKSTRNSVPNRSRDCIEPGQVPGMLPNYNPETHWTIIFHVLYHTDKMRLKADFEGRRRVKADSVRVYRLHRRSAEELNDQDLNLIDSGGNLQVLLWELIDPEVDRDYVVLWEWHDLEAEPAAL